MRVQPPGGVDDDHVPPAGAARFHRVEGDGRRVGSARGPDEVGSGTVGPDLELLLGRRAERVRRSDQHRAAVLGQLPGELPDRRRLAGAVHADDEDHARLAVQAEGRWVAEDGRDLLDEAVLDPDGLAPSLQAPDELGGRRNADVASDERLLEALPGLLATRVEPGGGELLGERAAALRQRVAHPREHAGALRLVGGRGLVAQKLGPGAAHPSEPMPRRARFAATAARRPARRRPDPWSRRRGRRPPPSSASGA